MRKNWFEVYNTEGVTIEKRYDDRLIANQSGELSIWKAHPPANSRGCNIPGHQALPNYGRGRFVSICNADNSFWNKPSTYEWGWDSHNSVKGKPEPDFDTAKKDPKIGDKDMFVRRR